MQEFPKDPVTEYELARPLIHTGDVLLCSGSGTFSKLIQAGTGSAWSHVAFLMWLPLLDRLMVLESVEGIGVRAVPLSSYLKDYNAGGEPYPGRLAVARHPDFDDQDWDALKRFGQFAADRLGYPYDNDEIARIAARIALGIHGKHENDKEYICSEFYAESMAAYGIDIPYHRQGFVAPADCAAVVDLVAVLR
tara:strand:+ start:2303 stop:2881 length:579 start_codon:yes stop_codon:yes gene_type:complete